MVVLNLVVCNFYVEALFCDLLRPFALLSILVFVLLDSEIPPVLLEIP